MVTVCPAWSSLAHRPRTDASLYSLPYKSAFAYLFNFFSFTYKRNNDTIIAAVRFHHFYFLSLCNVIIYVVGNVVKEKIADDSPERCCQPATRDSRAVVVCPNCYFFVSFLDFFFWGGYFYTLFLKLSRFANHYTDFYIRHMANEHEFTSFVLKLTNFFFRFFFWKGHMTAGTRRIPLRMTQL